MAGEGSFLARMPPIVSMLMVRLSGGARVLAIYVVYGLLHAIVTRLPGPALAMDDVKLNIVAQSFQLGYLPANPPLYEWILGCVQTIFGPGLISFLIVKYGLITIAGLGAYGAARQIVTDRSWAVASALSLTVLYQIGWNAHQAFTHSLALIAAVMVFWVALLRLITRRGMVDYALFGLALGVGVLSKYSFLAAAACALVASLSAASGRRALIDGRALVSLGVAGAVAAPHLAWVLAQNADIAVDAASRFQGEAAAHWLRALKGAPAALWAMGSFFLPLALMVGVAFPQIRRDWASADELSTIARNAAILGAGGLFAAVIIIGMPSLQERYVIAFLLPFVFWLFAKLEALAPSPRQWRRYRIGFVGVTACVLVIRFAQALWPGEPFCSNCRQWIAYEAIADHLTAQGFERGALVGFTDHTAGNLRRLFPKARVISGHMPFYTPPGGRPSDACYMIWSTDLGPPPPQRVIDYADRVGAVTVEGAANALLRPEGWMRTRWRIVRIDGEPRLRNEFCRPQVN